MPVKSWFVFYQDLSVLTSLCLTKVWVKNIGLWLTSRLSKFPLQLMTLSRAPLLRHAYTRKLDCREL